MMAKKRGNGEGSITKYTDGRWCARFTAQTPNGPKRRALYGKTRAGAAQKLAKALAGGTDGLVFDAGKLTLGEYLDKCLSGAVKDSVKQTTLENYEYIVNWVWV